MTRSSSGLLRWGFAVQIGENTPYGAVLYWMAAKRQWGDSVSQKLSDRIYGHFDTLSFIAVHEFPAGTLVNKHLLVRLLPERQRAKAMKEAVNKRER